MKFHEKFPSNPQPPRCIRLSRILDHARKSATNTLKTTSKRVIQKTTGATGDLIGNKIADAIATLHNDKTTNISSRNNP